MALTFPSNPTVGQTYTYNDESYEFDGKRWRRYEQPRGAEREVPTEDQIEEVELDEGYLYTGHSIIRRVKEGE